MSIPSWLLGFFAGAALVSAGSATVAAISDQFPPRLVFSAAMLYLFAALTVARS
jgi:hypothetical protein